MEVPRKRRPRPLTCLAVTHKHLESYWSAKNEVSFAEWKGHIDSKKKYFWELPCGHTLDRSIPYMISTLKENSKRDCSICVGKQVLFGFNDLATIRPGLVVEWNDTVKSPEEVVYLSSYEAAWKCPLGHEYTMKVWRRTGTSPRNCPACAGKLLVPGFNDLLNLYPSIAEEYSSRNETPVAEVLAGSHKKVLWECLKYGHEWETSPKSRTSRAKVSRCLVCTNKKFLPGFNDLQTKYPDLAKDSYSPNNPLPASEVKGWGKDVKYLWVCNRGHEWDAVPDNVIGGSGCPYCSFSVSSHELNILEFIKQIIPEEEIQTNRRVLKNLHNRYKTEIDIYIPKMNLGFEYNGVYYHSERYTPNTSRHKLKRESAKRQGINLIQIWEDAWTFRNTAVKNLIAAKLGKLDQITQNKVFARNLSIELISFEKASEFLDTYHIQGKASGKYYIGGFDQEGNLAAVMVLKHLNNTRYLLSRYATYGSVVGGHSKFISWVRKNLDISILETFADLDVSDGGLYESTGWVKVKELPEDYRYLVKGRREHKFNYRLNRFKNDPELIWEAGKSEKELAIMNGLYRVWDSGKVKYELDLNKLH